MRHVRRWMLALAACAGCGPIGYVSQVTHRADNAVDAARQVQADKYSPYYWTRATQYLRMAREVAGHADYQAANRFGRLAEEAALEAKEQAENPAKRPVNPMDQLAPAKDDKAVAPAKDAP